MSQKPEEKESQYHGGCCWFQELECDEDRKKTPAFSKMKIIVTLIKRISVECREPKGEERERTQ